MSTGAPWKQDRTTPTRLADPPFRSNRTSHTSVERLSIHDDMEMGRRPGTNAVGLEDANGPAKPKVDPNIIDWDGPNDPANPQNWTHGRRIGHVIVVSIITLIA